MSNRRYKKAIIRYETARQLAAKIEKQRHYLVVNCITLNESEDAFFRADHDGMPLPERINVNCLARAWKYMESTNSLAAGVYGESIDFDEAMELVDDVGVCENCATAYDIKRGPLKDARREFGAAKVSLAALGKSLIRQQGNGDSNE